MVRLLHFLVSLFTSSLRTRLSLQLEVAALRHQLALYQLERRRPRIAPADRLLWSLVARLWSNWRRALFFVQPRTVRLDPSRLDGYFGRAQTYYEMRLLTRAIADCEHVLQIESCHRPARELVKCIRREIF